MTEKQSGQLTIFELDDVEFENAELKNRCLVQTKTSYIAFVLHSTVAEESLLNAAVRQERAGLTVDGGFPVLFVSEGTGIEKTDYAGVFGLISQTVDALLFPKALIRETGAFNQGLSALTNYELLCRLVRETNKCELIDAAGKNGIGREQSVPSDDGQAACTLAYMVRYHLNSLHDIGMTDQVFSLFCEYMQSRGIFQVFQERVDRFLSDGREYERYAGRTAPFIVLRGDDTCGGVLQGFADDLSDGLAENGQAVILIDENFSEHEKLQNIVCKGVVGFQSKALEIDFFRRIRGPKFQFWFDNPLRFEKVLRNLPEEYYILCQDANYAALIRDYYHTPNAIQFPPGGRVRRRLQEELRDAGAGEPADGLKQECSKRERPYDIVFVGNHFSDQAGSLEGMQREFYDYMLEHPSETFEQGLSQLLLDKGRETEAEEFVRLSCALKPACRAVIGHFRNAVVSAVLEAGFSLHVYGESWRDYQGPGRDNLVIHPYVTVEESLEELSKARIGLNIMSWHKAGMTERIANIMLSGAVCLTEETEYLRDHMQEGRELVCFELNRLEELPGKIRNLLEHPELREEIAANAYRRASAEYTWERRARELIALSERDLNNALTVFVATHVKFNPPDNPIYVPLHVGKYGKPDMGYLGDDTGENISDLNFLYGELTGLFWIWQNVHDLDYAGLCHYRRYFINSKMQAMGKGEYLDLLEHCDAIVPKHADCEGNNYYEHFGMSHNIRDLDAVERALKRLYPFYAKAWDTAMSGTIYYWGNLVVTRLEILKAYAEWLFNIFAEASDEIDVSGYDDYHRRVYGFLSEQMFYVFALANGLRLCETAVGVSQEKAETRELKEQLKLLLEADKAEEARRLFDAQLKVRPDLLLPGSDVTGELQAIYRKLAQKRLVLFQGELDTINLFSDELKKGFLKLGYEIFDFDLRESAKSLSRFYEYMKEGPVTAMVAFNSTFFGMTTPSGENMWETLGIPCINIFVDHPYWYHNILMRMPANGIALCIDRNHMNYVNRFYPNIGSNGFLAHGGTLMCPNPALVSGRSIDILYAGSLLADHIPAQIDFSGWDFPAQMIWDRSMERLLDCPEDTVESVLEQELCREGIRLSDEELRRFISTCSPLERVVSSRYREQIVRSIAQAGIRLELYGDGWGSCEWISLPNVHYGGRVSPGEILSMMQDSKLVLNTLPWFKDGSHERVFNAMLSGAVAVSETSGYLEEILNPEAWVSFDLTKESLSALPQRIADLLADEDRLQKIASAGYELAAVSHTWEARAEELHRDLLSFL